MRRIILLLAVMLILGACGSSTSEEPTATTPPPSTEVTTPSQESATNLDSAAPAVNMSFAEALPLDGPESATLSPEVRELFYRFDAPMGGIVTATLNVQTDAPAPMQLVLYDEQQNFIANVAPAVGTKESIRYVLDASKGGTMFVSVAGSAGDFELQVDTAAQPDGASNQDAPSDEDYTQALQVAPGAYTGVIGNSDRSDLYVFEVPQTGVRLNLEATTTLGEVDVQIFDNDQHYRGTAAVSPSEPGRLTHLIPSDTGGRWYVRFHGEGEYAWNLALAEQNDADSGTDASAEDGGAVPIELGQIQAEVGDLDDADYYRLNMPKSGGTFQLNLESQGADIQLQLFNADQGYEDSATALPGEPVAVRRLLTAENAGPWLIRIQGEGTYSLTTEFTAQDDAGSATDAGEDFSEALTIDVGQFEGQIGDEDQYDMFRLPSAAGRTVNIVVLDGQGSLDAQLFTANESYGASGTTFDGESGLTLTMEEEGVYFLRIRGDLLRYGVEVLP